ncbi:hypothetical protein Taro_021907, partial [Colocasia esculenta]|nr:hypothetical protein [Colocasia esculenta]
MKWPVRILMAVISTGHDAKYVQMVLLLVVLVFKVGEGNGCISNGQCRYDNGPSPRPHSVSILEFGAVGDGRTINTLAFQNAVFYLRSFADKGGAQLYVPTGRWLTGSFNLTSHLTLFLEKDAIIVGTQDPSQWPVVEPLPSYGRGIELPGGRHRSLISDNGAINGQGSIWWDWVLSHSLNYSRPHLVELVYCKNITISNLTFLDSPDWHIHPVYSSNVHIQNITVHASPNFSYTSGIVPDSCSDVWIEDCTITVGHDAIVLKSGWDKYGILYGRPITNVHISRVELQTSLGSGLAFGSEMSGGVSDIYAEHLRIYDSFTGVKFKTTRGRGGYMKDIVISDVDMENVHTAIEFNGHCGHHPDDQFDPDVLPVISRVTLKKMTGKNITVAGILSGIDGDPFSAVCLSDIKFSVTSNLSWTCSNVQGFSQSVFPEPCPDLQPPYSNSSDLCYSLVGAVF